MTDLTEVKFEPRPTVCADLDYAFKAVSGWDVTAEQEGRSPIEGMAAVRILAEYGAIAYLAAATHEDVKLAVVVCPPSVWFCPSTNGLHGVFIEEYDADRHGAGIQFKKDRELNSWTNIDARIDGWNFFGEMLRLSGWCAEKSA